MFFEDDAYAIDKGLTRRLQMLNTAGAIVNHGQHFRISLAQASKNLICRLRIRENRPIEVQLSPLI